MCGNVGTFCEGVGPIFSVVGDGDDALGNDLIRPNQNEETSLVSVGKSTETLAFV